MSTSSEGRSLTHRAVIDCDTHNRKRTRTSPVRDLSDLGIEVVATRLRLFGHPSRLRIARLLDEREANIEDIAERLRLSPPVVSAHVRLLYEGGVVCRCDDGGRGPAVYGLADWPGWWLVEQLAKRVATGARQLRETVETEDRS